MTSDYFAFLHQAFERYTNRLQEGPLEPADTYLPYDFSDIERTRLNMWGSEMIRDELREITNRLNAWHNHLQRWQAWNEVIRTYGEAEAWDLRREFLEPMAHCCLIQPSATRDALIFVATNSVHQVRLAQGNYRDYLDGDPEPGKKPKHMTRRQKEVRLQGLMTSWQQAAVFMDHLRQIDSPAYRELTHDYRNRSSHAVGPRLAIGLTQAVTRSVVPETEMVQQDDGSYQEVPVAGRLCVQYSYGGTPPLDPESACAANLAQYRTARSCFEIFRTDLSSAVSALPRV